jgi:hypothetical protein
VRSKISTLSFFRPGSKCAISRRRHTKTVSASRRYYRNYSLANPLNSQNINQRLVHPAPNTNINRPETPQKVTIDYINLTSPDGPPTSPTQYDETNIRGIILIVRTTVRNAPVVPVNSNSGITPIHIISQPPAPHYLDAPYIAAGKIHFRIREKHRLIGREVRADPGFETKENIIINIQVTLKLPKQTDNSIVSI